MKAALVAVVVCVVLSLAVLAEAQTDPCAGSAPSTTAVRRNDIVRVAWCHSLTDDEGQSIPSGQVHFYLLDSTTKSLILDLGMPQPLVAAANGLFYYESTSTYSFNSDALIVVIAEFNGIRSLPATPLLVDVRGGPRSPSGVRVVLSQP